MLYMRVIQAVLAVVLSAALLTAPLAQAAEAASSAPAPSTAPGVWQARRALPRHDKLVFALTGATISLALPALFLGGVVLAQEQERWVLSDVMLTGMIVSPLLSAPAVYGAGLKLGYEPRLEPTLGRAWLGGIAGAGVGVVAGYGLAIVRNGSLQCTVAREAGQCHLSALIHLLMYTGLGGLLGVGAGSAWGAVGGIAKSGWGTGGLAPQGVTVKAAPTAFALPGGGLAPGLALSARF